MSERTMDERTPEQTGDALPTEVPPEQAAEERAAAERAAAERAAAEQAAAERAAAEEKAAAQAAELKRRRSYEDPGEVSGRSAGELIYVLALAVTAGADLAAFHQVVAIVLSTEQQWLVWLMVAGFTACSLTLAHFAGRLARDIVAGYGPASWRQFWWLAVPWVLLGLVAFLVRLIGVQATASYGIGSTSADSARIAAAFMFLVLYAASGAVAGIGEYLTRNPVRAGYRRALRNHKQAMRELERSQPAYEHAVQSYRRHARARDREKLNYEAGRAQRIAFADELKRYAAVLIAVHLQEPNKTEALTLPDRLPLAGVAGKDERRGPDGKAIRATPHSAAAIEAAPERERGPADVFSLRPRSTHPTAKDG